VIRITLALALLGATLGTALDALHVLSDTTRYTEPILFGVQAWWTPPIFAGAAVAIGMGRLLAGGDARPLAAPAMAIFVCAYVVSAVLDGLARPIVLFVLATIACVACERDARGAAFAMWAGIAGTIAEIALVHSGAFEYVATHPFGVPDWLPFLYVTAAVGVGSLTRHLADQRPMPSTSGMS
jgi:hypothetical protein